MSSTVGEPATDAKRSAIQELALRPALSLANEDANMGPSLQQMRASSASTKSIKMIPTFYIWSIFNLLFVPLGIVCCYFSHKVSHLKLQTRYEVASKWSKRTFVMNIMTTLLMIGIIITVVMLHYDYVQRNTDAPVNQTRTTGAFIPWQPGR